MGKSAQDVIPGVSEDLAAIDREEADARVLEFAEKLRSGKKPVQAKAPAGSLDECALRLLDALCREAPDWAERDAAWAAESGQTPAQRVIKYIGLVLDQQLHMNMLPGYDYLELKQEGVVQSQTGLTPMKGECPQCHQQFNRQVPGQICCSNECGIEYGLGPKKGKTIEQPQEFEDHLMAQLQHQAPETDPVRNIGVPAPGILR